MSVLLAEIDLTAPDGQAVTLRFSDQAVRPFAPTDPDRPNAAFDDRLVEAPVLRRRLFEDMASLTPGWGVGAMNLANADRALDAYQAHVWGAVRVRRWTPGQPFAASRLIFQGLCGAPRFDPAGGRATPVRVSIYDYRAELDKPLQQTTYSGAAGAGVYEGSAETLKGRPKPLAYGDLLNAHLPAVPVAPAVLGHQLHDGLLSGGLQIFDRGADAGAIIDADRSGAAFDSYNPAGAHAVTDYGRGLVKQNAAPVGTLTFGVRGDAAGGYVNTVGPILRRMLLRLGVPAGRIGTSVAALASAAPIGVFTQDAGPARRLVEWTARSALAALLPGRDGVWQVVKIAPPAAVAAYAINPHDVVDIKADGAAAVPAGVVRVGWGRIWTTLAGTELAPAIRGTAAGDRLAEEYRFAVVEDAVVKARLAETWRTMEIETALRAEADAQALAAALKALFGLRPDGRPRRQWAVTLQMTDDVLDVPLGATVRLPWPDFGLDENLLLIGEEPFRPRRDLITWTLWG